MSNKIRICAVLSAGGVRSVYAHTDFLQCLDSIDLRISALTGCSAGAIVGGIYASGTPLNQWLDALEHMRWKDFWEPGSWMRTISELVLHRGKTFTGVATTDAPLNFCRRNIAVSTFEECHTPFHTVATSLATGKKMFSQGDLALGIAASASLPLLYQPVEIDGEYYCDGGVIDLGPTNAICCRHKLDVLVVHHVEARTKGFHGVCSSNGNGWPILGIIDSLLFRNRSWYLSDQPLTFRRCPCGCDASIVVLEPSLPELPWPQTEHGPKVQKAAKNQAEELLEPYLDVIRRAPSELLEQIQSPETPATSGGCHC
ncbi:NTE family protein [Mariprofundus micogutta]|uniref:NTE family protein n=1 Tax=Mariprofundus micogutta TaxID=1921010 RepID=A0A1L8CNY5_9PROT|nr:patatin-like phospholipase family protein [Mariprofundus micogutta]GAV20635.1 NTE family protein [Mariprofundus micogutta]